MTQYCYFEVKYVLGFKKFNMIEFLKIDLDEESISY